MPPTPQTSKLISTLHLLIPRLRLLQKKATAQAVIQRRDLATLLSEGRDASARIRVENVIAGDVALEVMEMVELYCELILARANVLDQMAFADQGGRARNRAREEALSLSKGNKGKSGSGSASASGDREKKAAGAGGGGGGFFSSFFRSSPAPSQSPAPAPASPPKQTTTTTEAPSPPDHPPESDPEPEIEIESEPYIDTALDESAAAIFYAYPRFPSEVRELTMLRSMLSERWGKDFMALAQDNRVPGVKVPERLVKGLGVKPPSKELVESYLVEIARAYGVEHPLYNNKQEKEQEQEQGQDDSGQGHDANKDEHGGGEGGDGDGGGNPVSVAPPGPRSDNPNPRVKLPSSSPDQGNADADAGSKTKSGNGIPEVDELSRRFAALRR